MAHYLIEVPGSDEPHMPSTLIEVEGVNLTQAIESLDVDLGGSVRVWRMAGLARRVTVRTETIRRVTIE